MKDLRGAVTTEHVWGSAPVFVTCPLEDKHIDIDSSLAVYPDHGYCYGCRSWFSPGQVLEFTGKKEEDLRDATHVSPSPSRRTGVAADASYHQLVDLYHNSLVHPSSPVRPRVSWLRDRGISWETIHRHKLGHTGKRFSIPVPLGGFIKLRADPLYCGTDEPRYMGPSGVPSSLFVVEGSRDIVVTEGEFDTLLLGQLGYTAMTSTGGAGSIPEVVGPALSKRKSRYIYCATDQDQPGEEAYENLRLYVAPRRVIRLRWKNGNDITDLFRGASRAEQSRIVEVMKQRA